MHKGLIDHVQKDMSESRCFTSSQPERKSSGLNFAHSAAVSKFVHLWYRERKKTADMSSRRVRAEAVRQGRGTTERGKLQQKEAVTPDDNTTRISEVNSKDE